MKVDGLLLLLLKDARHFVWIELYLKIDSLKELHVSEAIAITSNQLVLHALDLTLLLL